jgi:glycosyltransferase involved in cell wall biosynthesis
MPYCWLHRLGMRIATVTSDLADLVSTLTRVPRDRIAVVQNGIRIPERLAVPVRDAWRAEIRADLGLASAERLIVCVGNLYPVKDHATLLRACATLAEVHVAIAGRGEEEAALRALAAELGMASRVHLLGLRDDIPRLLAAADLFVHPSRSEELPLAVLEAMAAAKAVVATRVGGVPDAVVSGETGLLVGPGEPKPLADAIETLLRDPSLAERLGQAARCRVEALFDHERMVDRYLEIYESLSAAS